MHVTSAGAGDNRIIDRTRQQQMSISHNIDKIELSGLIDEVKRGSQTAFIRLLAKYEPMIRSQVGQYTSDTQDSEDHRQEALAAFYRAIMTYDSDRPGVEFGLYAKICVSNALITQARAAKRRAGNTVASLEYNDYSRYGSGADEDPAKRVIEQENEKALRGLIAENLSDYENRVWTLYMSGFSSDDISRKLSRSEKSISNALYRIKRKLRSLFDK